MHTTTTAGQDAGPMIRADLPTFVTIAQAAASLGVKPWHLVERVEAGTLRAVRHDGVVLVEVAGLRTETGE